MSTPAGMTLKSEPPGWHFRLRATVHSVPAPAAEARPWCLYSVDPPFRGRYTKLTKLCSPPSRPGTPESSCITTSRSTSFRQRPSPVFAAGTLRSSHTDPSFLRPSFAHGLSNPQSRIHPRAGWHGSRAFCSLQLIRHDERARLRRFPP